MPPKVLFITRRFWPLVGGAETMIANLSAAMMARRKGDDPHRSLGIELAAGNNASRSARCPAAASAATNLGYAPIHARSFPLARRPSQPIRFGLRLAIETRCLRSRANWPQSKISRRFAATGGGELGDCHWQTIGRCGMRIRRETRRAMAIVAPSPAIRDELLAAGFPSSTVVLLPSGVPIGPAVNPLRRQQARSTIAAANAALSLGRLHAFGRLHRPAARRQGADRTDCRLGTNRGPAFRHAALAGGRRAATPGDPCNRSTRSDFPAELSCPARSTMSTTFWRRRICSCCRRIRKVCLMHCWKRWRSVCRWLRPIFRETPP